MAFDPRRHLAVVRPPPRRASNARRCLQRMLPDSWRFAYQLTLDLARQIEHLAWTGRVDGFDAFFLRQAETMLRPQGLVDLISGDRSALEAFAAQDLERRTARFAGWCRAVTTAVLLELAERPEVSCPHQALTYLLSGDLRLARLAAGWAGDHGIAQVERLLRDLPGYALVLLATSPNDTAERFVARDAFWAAVSRRS